MGVSNVGNNNKRANFLKLTTINISGLHNLAKMRSLLMYCIFFDLDVITLTETHLNPITTLVFRDVFENSYWVGTSNRNNKKKSSGGVAILINKRFLQKEPTFISCSKSEGHVPGALHIHSLFKKRTYFGQDSIGLNTI